MNNLYRHGDLLIRQINELPKELKETKNPILAEGEFTGHRHALITNKPDLTIYEDAEGKKYFKVGTQVDLIHQEHKTITIEKGLYVVEREKEYDPFVEEIKRVQD